jgi:hypothetical protein
MRRWLQAARNNLKLTLPPISARRDVEESKVSESREAKMDGKTDSSTLDDLTTDFNVMSIENKGEETAQITGNFLVSNKLPAFESLFYENDCPIKFLCSINHHIMRNPMKSKDNIFYEHDTILLWLKEMVCFHPSILLLIFTLFLLLH